MHLRLFLAVTVTLTFPSAVTLAANQDGIYTALQKGNDSCGSFIAAAQKGANQDSWAQWNLYTSYAMGYLTGVNAYLANTKNIMGSTDTEGVMANVEKFCKSHPLKNFAEAVDETAVELYPNRKQ